MVFHCLRRYPGRTLVLVTLKVKHCLPFSLLCIVWFFGLPHFTSWLNPLFFPLIMQCFISFILSSLSSSDNTNANRTERISTSVHNADSIFFKTRALHACSPLGPAIQTDLLCWGVISTGWPPLHSFPASLGPPTAGDWCQLGILPQISFCLLQSHPASQKTLAPAQRALVKL